VNFADNGGFADTRITGDHHQFAPAVCRALEGFQQSGDFRVAPINARRDVQFIGAVEARQFKRLDCLVGLPLRATFR